MSKNKQFTASVWQEEEWYVAHCNEIEIASQGKSVNEALIYLQEAMELYFEEPTATIFPDIYKFEAEVNSFKNIYSINALKLYCI
jgi:predicted RNase H-like HicB family nuclease